MSFNDNISKLIKLLDQFPEMETPDDFDIELEKRRKIYREIRGEVEQLGNDIEKTWSEGAWENVKRKKMIVHPDTVLKGKKEWVRET